ncbi:MarR family winged helix-turn-helix transcriptional regulator [Streptosporangium saharense]|uniref:DNA-binding MarR family transcriptional regulator n=1 Tax=Streptosporangium saharense TaxID=1706840 RepID=A0A7W7QJT3_9ACTN|nr:MarR family transcriptional regulator [Streptosporangium saharense]MBB4914859.1 DNA-binding MarR family transcriptional regulator [Streptosporangium saharense]
MEKTPARLTAKPSWLITQLAVHAHRLASDGFGEMGARGYHYRVLVALEQFGVASQAELGRRCNMDRSDIVATINELAGQGLVERTPDPDDRRRNLVTITTAGERHLRRLEQTLDRVQEDLLAPLTSEDRQTLTHLLTQLLAHHQRG